MKLNNMKGAIQMDYMKQNNCGCQTPATPSICYDNYDVLQDLPLAMSYVPWQQWQNVLDGAKGLECGTIFEELKFPFKCASPVCRNNGCGMNWGCQGQAPEPRTRGCNSMPNRCETPSPCINQGNMNRSNCGCQHPHHNSCNNTCSNSCGRRCDV